MCLAQSVNSMKKFNFLKFCIRVQIPLKAKNFLCFYFQFFYYLNFKLCKLLSTCSNSLVVTSEVKRRYRVQIHLTAKNFSFQKFSPKIQLNGQPTKTRHHNTDKSRTS